MGLQQSVHGDTGKGAERQVTQGPAGRGEVFWLLPLNEMGAMEGFREEA